MAHVVHEQTAAPSSPQITQPVCNENFAAFLKLRDEIGPAEDDFLIDRNREVPSSRDLL